MQPKNKISEQDIDNDLDNIKTELKKIYLKYKTNKDRLLRIEKKLREIESFILSKKEEEKYRDILKEIKNN